MIKLPCTWRKGHRYYKVHLQSHFFGSTSIICSWGSVCNNLGNCKIIICETEQEVDAALKRIIRIRQYRGYNVSSTFN